MEGSFERKAVGNLGTEIIQNGTKLVIWSIWVASGPKWFKLVQKLRHLEHLGGLGPKRLQNDTKTNHSEHLNSLDPK